MSSTYSTNLAIELIGTGDQAGSWGNTTNTNLGTLIEQAISGYVTQAVSTGTDTTITIPNGATGVARNMYIELTGTGGTNTNLIVPANKKLYFIYNNSTGAVTVKVSGQTGVSVPAGKKMVLVSNGTDIVNGLNYIADFGTNSFTVTNLTATSASITTLTGTSAGITTLSSGSANITQLNSTSASITTLTGTSANITTLSGTTATFTSATVTNLALTSLTLSNLSIASANITTLTSSSATISTTLALSGGTANGVLYLNGSKVATSGSALTFDGTNLGVGGTAIVGLPVEVTATTSGYTAKTATSNFNYGAFYQTSSVLTVESGISGNATYTPMAFKVSAAEQMRLTSTGLGIGTSSPGAKLDIVTSSTTAGVRVNNATAGKSAMIIQNNGSTVGIIGLTGYWNGNSDTNFGLYAETGSDIRFSTNGVAAPKAIIDTSGNLGIGTSSPNAKATVDVGTGTQYYSGQATLTNTSADTGIIGFVQGDQNTPYRAGMLARQSYNATSGFTDSIVQFVVNKGGTGQTTAATFDSSGNLGIGTSSPGYQLDTNNSSGGTIARFVNGSGRGYVRMDGYDDMTLQFYRRGSSVGFIQTDSSGTELYAGTTGAYPLVFYTNNTERARITSGGDLLVNTTTTAGIVTVDQRGSSGTGSVTSAYNHFHANTKYVDFLWYGSNIGAIANEGGTGVGFYTSGTTNGIYHVGTNIVGFKTNNTERAQITAGGYFKASDAGTYNNATGTYHELRQTANDTCAYISATNASMAYNVIAAVATRGASSAFNFLSCAANSVDQFYVRGDGVVYAQNTTIQSISDARLKENVRDASEGLNVINSLRPVRYDWKEGFGNDRKNQLGFIAQEVEAVFPDAVSEWKAKEGEETYKTVGPAALIPVLVKAIQELKAELDATKAEVAALKGA